MVVHICNPSTPKTEGGRQSLRPCISSKTCLQKKPWVQTPVLPKKKERKDLGMLVMAIVSRRANTMSSLQKTYSQKTLDSALHPPYLPITNNRKKPFLFKEPPKIPWRNWYTCHLKFPWSCKPTETSLPSKTGGSLWNPILSYYDVGVQFFHYLQKLNSRFTI
jgi:hypothetical protein